MKTILEQLKEYGASDYYGFHMPGHKRNKELMKNSLPYDLDITEIEGFDDLHHADGILKQAQERAARLYGAEETHFLVNGSTVGILSAILGCTAKGDKILVARNCHKSVYNAIFLNELEPVYIYPEYDCKNGLNGELQASDIEESLKQEPDIKAVMIVSPTYDGVVSDVEKIAGIVHRYHIPLIVDEAHGAHFGFHPYFPENANQRGADIVIHSVHKTLPSMTQTALLHMNGTLAERERVRMYLHMLQSSSPSYVLMASIDACMDLLENRKEEIFGDYTEKLQKLWEDLKNLKHLKVVKTKHYDRSKIVISVKDTNLSSRELSRILLETYHLQMEMTSGDYVLAMTSLGDREKGFERLKQALLEIDENIQEKESSFVWKELPRAVRVCKSAEVLNEKGSIVKWEESLGRVSMEYAYLYPPGIPILVPGEEVTQEVTYYLEMYRKQGLSIEGLEKNDCIKVREEHE